MTAKRRIGDISRPRSPTCLNSAVHQPNPMNVPFVQILYESHSTSGRKWYLFKNTDIIKQGYEDYIFHSLNIKNIRLYEWTKHK